MVARRAGMALLALLAFGASPREARAEDYALRLYTEKAGLHRVAFEDLLAADPALAPLPSAALSLDNLGRLVPMALADGGDGTFGPGDWFEFAAETLAGEHTYYHPYSRHNVYWLRLAPERARRIPMVGPADPDALASARPLRARRRQHLEHDQLLIRLPDSVVAGEIEPELWYWSKLTHLDEAPFEVELDLADADLTAESALSLGVRGLSSKPPARAAEGWRDHQLQILGNGAMIANFTWEGRDAHQVARDHLTWPKVDAGQQIELAVALPPRTLDDEPIVDVVMLDWIEVEYDFNGRLGAEQVEILLPPGAADGVLELHAAEPGRYVVFGAASGYSELAFDAPGTARLRVAAGEDSLWVRPAGAPYRAVAIETDRPSTLAAFDRQADYLMIAHGSLLDATQELAELHRARGLTVELIDVQDVYDEFGFGIVAPQAIRDFLAHAYYNWRPPRPRFVLLVGDASWDTKNATVDEANYANWVGRQLLAGDRFVAKKTEDYDTALLNDRNLIPSWNYHTSEGHAASDAYYTLIAGDDDLPDLALGRFPVASGEEVKTITRKIRRYIDAAPLGPWRGRLTWISGALASHQRRSQDLARDFSAAGWRSTVILPGAKARLEDRERIVESFDDGNLITHFIGHGGRFIWRTGPPDLSNQVDLFGLSDLEALATNAALPVVLSVACYSAPFDHPSADSIGEAFLRLEDRGAIAFIGASWRNAPPLSLSTVLVSELARPGTIGEALMRTKRQMTAPDPIHLYNLLGDPAVPVAAPSRALEVAVERTAAELEITVRLPADAAGGQVELGILDGDGAPLASFQEPAAGGALRVDRPADPAAATVTAYYWNERTGDDGLGAAPVPPADGGQSAVPPAHGGQSAVPPTDGGQSAVPPTDGGQSAVPPAHGGE